MGRNLVTLYNLFNGLLSLAGTIVPPVLFLTKTLALGPMKLIMLIAMVGWFVPAPVWMKGGDH